MNEVNLHVDLPKAPSDDEAVQNDIMTEEEREDDGEDKGDGDGDEEEEGEIEEHVDEKDEEDGASSLKEFSQPTSLPSYLNPISLPGASVLEEAFLSLPSIPGQ